MVTAVPSASDLGYMLSSYDGLPKIHFKVGIG
jgi:hypothetical protein